VEFFHINGEPFDRLFDLRAGKAADREVDFAQLLADYMQQISRVIEAVDSL
jgi:hypothetical protein